MKNVNGTEGRGRHVVAALSGGVDSAVAAYLLKKSGYEVTGVIMRIWDPSLPMPSGERSACFGPDEDRDIDDAKRVCERLGIELRVVDCGSAFRRVVLDYFRSEYEQGRTPNPCVFCNRHIKFDLIQRLMRESGLCFDFFATGHYARTIDTGGGMMLCRAADRAKDQSYFLYRLDRNQIGQTIFPLGDMTKQEVRTTAETVGLPVSHKEESQDFYAGDYRELLQHLHIEGKAGNIVDESGRVLGRHNGVHHYTIGQRRGLGIASSEPLYVVGMDAERGEVIVGRQSARLKRRLVADSLNMFVDRLPAAVQAQIRSSHTAAACAATLSNDTLEVVFDEPQENITPGQSVVVYEGDVVLGGGVIREAL